MNEIAVEVNNLSKMFKLYASQGSRILEYASLGRKQNYQEFWAFRDVSFVIPKGITCGIIGHNGSGKSTLLSIIAGVLEPTGGSIQVNGKVSAILELGAGFHPDFTGRENIYMYGSIVGLSRKEIDKKIYDIINFSELSFFIDQPLRTYSSGMTARLAFSVIINVNSDILIVDEALSVGDVSFQAKCISKIKQLSQSGVTILYVSHDIIGVKSLCESAVLLHEGKQIGFGSAGPICDKYLSLMRLKSNNNICENDGSNSDVNTITPINCYGIEPIHFKESSAFDEYVNEFRYGTGEAKVTYVEILNYQKNVISHINFNEELTFRIYIQFHSDIDIIVVYYIRDEKKIELLGSNSIIEDQSIISGKKGDRYVVDFITKIPLTDGVYTILIELNKVIVIDKSVVHVDVVENAALFHVYQREYTRIWSKAYFPNKMEIYKVLNH